MDPLTLAAYKAWAFIRDALQGLPSLLGDLTCGTRTTILAEIAAERVRQLDKWGVQSHPCTPAHVLDGLGETGNAMVERQIANELERAAKADCERNFKLGRGTWWAIAWEELAESGAATDMPARRQELIQTAAVLVAWIEDIDKKLEENKP